MSTSHVKLESPVETAPPATSRGWRHLATRNNVGPVVVLVLLFGVFTAMSPNFLTADNMVNILNAMAVLLVVACAGTFVIVMGSIDLSVGSIVTLSGLAGAVLVADHGAWALLAVPAIGVACGLVNGMLFAYAKLPSFLVTLGGLFAFNGVALYVSGGAPTPIFVPDVARYFTGSVFSWLPAITVWALAVLLVCIVIGRYTRFGRIMYALGGGERVAVLSGINAKRYKLYAFVLSGLLCGIAALLLLFRINAGTPDMGADYLLTSLAAVVMGGTALSGGIGGPHRTLLGVLIIAVLSNGMDVAEVDTFLQTVAQGVAVIVAVALTIDRSKQELIK
jgi:ribose transport system permease protein/putative xylitol transport system permease protein